MSTCRRGSGQRCARTPALCQPSTNQSSAFHLSPPQSSLASHTRHPPSARPGARRHVHGQRACSLHFPGPSPTPGAGRGAEGGAAAPVRGAAHSGRGVADTPAARCALIDLLRAVAAGVGLVHMGQVTKSPPWQEGAGARAGQFPAKLCAVEETEAEPARCPTETQAELARPALNALGHR